MTAILSIDTAAMRLLATRIRDAAQTGLGDHGGWQPAVTALGAPALMQAMSVFLDRWGAAVADLVDDAHRLADVIDLAARSYQDVESVSTRGMLG
ncbi:MAG TPA: hypothetical protein VLL08_30270 [Kineosporiaceae bacterium]|nr:hypothetical protein [Kineosporiaceae bacterium]